MNAWSHLPNAGHIDRIIASVKAHPEAWAAARAAAWAAARTSRTLTAAINAAWPAARDSILALIAYDDAAKYLEMSSYELKIWAALSEEPAAVLLLPAVIAFEKIKETEFVS